MKRPETAKGARPIAEIAGSLLTEAFAKQGFASREIINRWSEIAGERLAAHCRPLRLGWPKRRPAPGEAAEPAVLELKVEGAFALEAQQSVPVILARINTYLGWQAVGRIVLKQGPVDAPPRAAAPSPVAPKPSAEVVQAAASIKDEGLRRALEKLGASITAKSKGV
ncbi:MAG: DUF721 domain-containing protein [Bosea sp. (in: a-proteobacteria)]